MACPIIKRSSSRCQRRGELARRCTSSSRWRRVEGLLSRYDRRRVRPTVVASKANSWSHEEHDRRRFEAVRRRVRRLFNIVPGGQSARARGQWRTACSSLQLVIAEASLQGSLSCQGCLSLAASRELVNRKSSSPHRWTDLVSRVVSECSLVVVATRPSCRTGSRLQSLVVPRPSRYSSSRAQEFCVSGGTRHGCAPPQESSSSRQKAARH